MPTYNPTVVYGAWPYPAYPPYYYYPPMYPPGAAFFSFTAGVIIGGAFWGNCNWGSSDIDINVNRNTNINTGGNRNNVGNNAGNRGGVSDNAANRRAGNNAAGVSNNAAGGGKWNHDPSHRKGAGYRDSATQNKYGKGQNANNVQSREQFRGRAEQGRQDIAAGGATRDLAGNQLGGGNRAGTQPAGGNRAGGGAAAGTQPAGGNRAGGQGRRAAGTRPTQPLVGESRLDGESQLDLSRFGSVPQLEQRELYAFGEPARLLEPKLRRLLRRRHVPRRRRHARRRRPTLMIGRKRTGGALAVAALTLLAGCDLFGGGQARYDSPDQASEALLAAVSSGDTSAMLRVLGEDAEPLDRLRAIRSRTPTPATSSSPRTPTRTVGRAKPPTSPRSSSATTTGRSRSRSSKTATIGASTPRTASRKSWIAASARTSSPRSRRRSPTWMRSASITGGIPKVLRCCTMRAASSARTGRKDGLFWEAAEGETPSPLGALFASARAEGYLVDSNVRPVPYYGYHFRMLDGARRARRGRRLRLRRRRPPDRRLWTARVSCRARLDAES